LSLPYLLMLGFDIRGKRKNKNEAAVGSETDNFPEDAFIVEDDFKEEEKTSGKP